MKDDEFQSIYNLHEYLITLAVKHTKTASLDDERLKRLDSMFEVNSVKNPTDKSINAQNCRKSASLSRLLLRHKLNLVSDAKLDVFPILEAYITMFKEVASLVFDIGVFLPSVPEASYPKLVALYDSFIEKEADKMRNCRLQLNRFRLKQMLNIPTNQIELQEAYLACTGLDLKPEKGERKVCDDFVLLINEQSPKQTTDELLYLVTLNEVALQLSPYNFDI